MGIKIRKMQRTFLILSIVLLSNISFAFAEDVTVYNIDDGLCGELQLNSYVASFATKFGPVNYGNCKDQGYTIFDHKEQVSVGPFGKFDVQIYKKENSLT